jgi:uncharacterized protein YgbK (DUF1537 family)
VHETEFADDALNPVRHCDIRTILGSVEAHVLDGEHETDVRDAAQRVLEEPRPQLCAGPAGLAEALAEELNPRGGVPLNLPRLSRCLVVNGSRHPSSIVQMETAEREGVFREGWVRDDTELQGSGVERAQRTGEHVRRILCGSQFDGIIVFGGDTAFGIHRACGSLPFEPLGEVARGVPISKCGEHFWITKAGGFGPPDILCTIKRRLT